MKKKDNKGFTLIETLVVTVFIATVLIFLFIQLSNLSKSYDESFKYNTVEGLYALEDIKDYIESDSSALDAIEKELKINNYIDITDCSIFSDQDYCEKLFKLENLENIIVADNLDDYDNLIDEGEQDNYSTYACNVISGDLDTIGSKVKCGTETFYVIPDHDTASSGTVSLLSVNTITLESAEDANSLQTTTLETIGFYGDVNIDSDNLVEHYWGTVDPGTFVYDSRSHIYPYVEAYKNTLSKLGLVDFDVTLLSYNQLIDLGCEFFHEEDNLPYGKCQNSYAYSWLAGDYWTGSSVWWDTSVWTDKPLVYGVIFIMSNGMVHYDDYYDDQTNIDLKILKGIRPVVIIDKSKINTQYNSTSLYSKEFIKFISKINNKSTEPYRIIASFNNETYATVRFGE